MADWNIYVVLVVLEIFTITYVVLGGIEAVIWTAVLQGIVLAAGGLACLAVLLFRPEGGPEAVLSLAWENNKFSLGGMSFDFQEPTFLVLAMYGLSVYIQKYATDQAVVQRYLVAKTNREALHGTLLGALLCIPVWAMFLLIGSCLWAYCQITGLTFPEYINKSDEIFPYFIVHELPTGLSGLVLAALIAAAIDADLNSISVVIVEDYYRRFRPQATDAQRLFVGKLTIALTGIGTIGMAAILASSQGTALSTAFVIASIVSGGVTGLFALAFLCPRATTFGAYVGILFAVVFTAWATLTHKELIHTWGYRYTLHPYLIGVFANVLLFCTGYVASLLTQPSANARALTIWGWLASSSSRMDSDQAVPPKSGSVSNALHASPLAE
jgi:SSS family solute:Na+ symporter